MFRSTDLNHLNDDDVSALEQLGLRTVYDLRTLAERTAEPDVCIPSANEVVLDVLADAAAALPANLVTIFTDPAQVAKAGKYLEDGEALAIISGTYRELITLPSAMTSYRRFFRGLLGEDDTPALFHCTTGKDRTGWAAASFLTLMGVPSDDVFRDYLLTNEQLIPALKPVFDAFAAAGGNPDDLRPVLGVERKYLESAFDEVDKRFGSIDDYFAEGLGVGLEEQDALRHKYLDPDFSTR